MECPSIADPHAQEPICSAQLETPHGCFGLRSVKTPGARRDAVVCAGAEPCGSGISGEARAHRHQEEHDAGERRRTSSCFHRPRATDEVGCGKLMGNHVGVKYNGCSLRIGNRSEGPRREYSCPRSRAVTRSALVRTSAVGEDQAGLKDASVIEPGWSQLMSRSG